VNQMPIDTNVEGNPDSVRGVADWLRNSFANTLSDASTQVYNARNSADSGTPAGKVLLLKRFG
jgi:hypothetical protein